MMRVGVLVLLAMLLVSSQISQVFAEGEGPSYTEPPAISNRQKAHLDITATDDGISEDACKTESGDTITLSGGSNLEKIFNFFIDKGLSPEQAAGIVGNISVESGGDPENIQNPAGQTKDPSHISAGWGIIQWTPGSKIIGLLETADIRTPVYELGTQLEMVWWHMNNSSPTSSINMYKQYKDITDVAEATRVFEERMEGAKDGGDIETRIERAKEALRQYGGGGSSTGSETESSAASGSGCGDTENGGTASAHGFTFPLKTTQKAITTNSVGKWCYQSQTNCHHDYKAADIMITTGTTVITAKEGDIQNANTGNQHPNNVTITTKDGKGINYYTHMGANTVSVRIGQHVNAGDPLGKVGTSVDAMGTGPHLHFDMLPPQYKYRPSCSGPSCSGYPFIEVQPVLIETFNKLPKG